VKIGIGLPNQVRNVDPSIIPAFATRAEAAGFSSLGTVGRVAFPGVMDTVALAAAGGATQSIGLIANVLLGTVWPPVLLAKEIAGIDGISGGRLTLGLGRGGRPDDFVVDGLPAKGLGARFDSDLEVYRRVWGGEPVGGGENSAVPAGTREVPLLFGALAPKAMARMAQWGEGYIGGSFPAAMVGPFFDQARQAWAAAGREGSPRLVALAYYAFGDIDQGRANVFDYYSGLGKETADMVSGTFPAGADSVRAVARQFDDLGADELIFNTTVPHLDQIEQLADAVLR
jgi:alkanesulfonate monooxygenase SsuD/methylene tetrahydromethanopterin reductase-like flavin-dependent oxidoreductase (luciferase family)